MFQKHFLLLSLFPLAILLLSVLQYIPVTQADLLSFIELLVPETAETPAENEERPSDTGSEARTHTVVRGDTLWAICRQYYGEPTLYAKLASYNGVKNANLIYPGQVLNIPPKEKLAETAVTCSTAAIAAKPAPSTKVELGGKTYNVVHYGNKDDPAIVAAQLSRSGVLNYGVPRYN